MVKSNGVIYILINPSFPDYIKIGYADNIEQRLQQLNRSECVPFAFRVYATYEVSSRLSDKKIHAIIDKLNPSLRSIDIFQGQKRVREFYAMPPEDAYSILEAIAEIHGCTDKLHLILPSDDQLNDEGVAQEIQEVKKDRAIPFSFERCGIPAGSVLQFWRSVNESTEMYCTVADSKKVEYEGVLYSLSSLASKLTNKPYPLPGPCYFKFNGKWLNDIRNEVGF